MVGGRRGGGKRNIIKEVMAGACFSQDRSRRDDNTRTHRHLGATIVKLGQVKVRSVWDLLLGGRTGAGYRLGIIVLDSPAVGLSREGCAYGTRILRGGPGDDIGSLIGQIPEKNALLRLLSLPHSISPSLFSFSIAASHGVPLCFREGGARMGLLTLPRRSQGRELGNYT